MEPVCCTHTYEQFSDMTVIYVSVTFCITVLNSDQLACVKASFLFAYYVFFACVFLITVSLDVSSNATTACDKSSSNDLPGHRVTYSCNFSITKHL